MPKFERHGKADPAPGPLHVHTDAVLYPGRSLYGIAYIASNGPWGMRLGDYDARTPPDTATLDAKIRAIAYALETAPTDEDAAIYSDSMAAVGAFANWRENLPQAIPYLHDLRLPKGQRDKYTFAWSPSSGEDPLAEWADSAARLAVRIGSRQVPRRDATRLLTSWADARLGDWGRARKEALP